MKRIMGLSLIAIVLLFACELDVEKEVEYKVTCSSGTVDITIENEDGGCSQFGDVATPWTYSFMVDKPTYGGVFVYVSAQNQQDHGTVTSTIYVDGSQFKTSTSTGAYVIATASGSVDW